MGRTCISLLCLVTVCVHLGKHIYFYSFLLPCLLNFFLHYVLIYIYILHVIYNSHIVTKDQFYFQYLSFYVLSSLSNSSFFSWSILLVNINMHLLQRNLGSCQKICYCSCRRNCVAASLLPCYLLPYTYKHTAKKYKKFEMRSLCCKLYSSELMNVTIRL